MSVELFVKWLRRLTLVFCQINPLLTTSHAAQVVQAPLTQPITDKSKTIWSEVAIRAAGKIKLQPPMASRVSAILHTCIYDTWVAYDEKAVGTQLGGALRRPASERTEANKEKAISYAAYRALTDLFPAATETEYKPLMRKLGYDPNDASTDIETPAGIGNVACAAVLEFHRHDIFDHNSAAGLSTNQNRYSPVNSPGTLPAQSVYVKPFNPDHWQPLTYTDSSGNLLVQMFEESNWGTNSPFALEKADEFRAGLDPPPAKYGSAEFLMQADELVSLNGNLSDRQKMLVDFWCNGSDSSAPIANWFRFAEFISARDHLSLDDQVKLNFALSNALFDTSIATWDAKRFYDTARPATDIPLLFREKTIKTWRGPGKGTIEADGRSWFPYQPPSNPTPPSPEYPSEESAFSAAAAEILARFTGSDRFGYSVALAKGSSQIEPGITPSQAITLKWTSFSEASNDAGLATRYAGIHFAPADLAGRKFGRLVAARVWAKSQSYFNGTAYMSPASSSSLP